MTDRRDFLRLVPPSLLAATLAAAGPSESSAQDAQATIFAEFLTPETDPEFGGGAGAVSTGPARHSEVVKGVYLLFQAPRTPAHMEIARYFLNISEKNADGELYNSEWKNGRSNPLIVSLFSATFTAPSVLAGGDETAWCAAFVNFVLMLSGRQGTWSALSGSFRTSDKQPAVTVPKVGDIVVLRDKGPSGDKGHGHVGFLSSPFDPSSGKVEILGGNQGGNGGRVSVGTFNIENGAKELHSFRAVK